MKKHCQAVTSAISCDGDSLADVLCVQAEVYCDWKASMAAENLAEVIGSLTLEEQAFVKQFIDFLKAKGSAPSSPFLAAVDEFIDQHPELLRRLAQ